MRNRGFIKKIKDRGLREVLSRGVGMLAFNRLFADYLDIMGVFDGSRAYKGPGFVQIDLTNNCNNNCIGCWCNSPLLGEKKIDPLVKNQTLPFERVIRLIEELCAIGTSELYFAGGGEPFMHPQIMEILRYSKKKGFICYVNTNFTLVDEQKAGALADMEVDYLTVSVWAGTPEVYSATHPDKDASVFIKIKETLKFLNAHKKKYPRIKVYNVVFNMNYRDMEAMVEFALQTGSESIEFTVIDTIPRKTDSLLLNTDEKNELLRTCQKIKTKYDAGGFGRGFQLTGFEQFIRRISHEGPNPEEHDSGIIGTIPCYAGWAFVRILADGNVNSCLKSHRFPVGNILKSDFRPIWNGRLQQHFRKKTLRFDKRDPFFSLIGNDPDATMGCFKSCDNIGHNMDLHGKLNSLNRVEKGLLKNVVKAVNLFKPNSAAVENVGNPD